MPTQGNATDRGYDRKHQIQRERLKYNHVDGTPCDICGQPMYRDKERNPDHATLEADHREGDKTQLAYRLLHRHCNRAIANKWVEHGSGWYAQQGLNQPEVTDMLDWPGGRFIAWPD